MIALHTAVTQFLNYLYAGFIFLTLQRIMFVCFSVMCLCLRSPNHQPVSAASKINTAGTHFKKLFTCLYTTSVVSTFYFNLNCQRKNVHAGEVSLTAYVYSTVFVV